MFLIFDSKRKRRTKKKKLSNFAPKSVKNVENNHFPGFLPTHGVRGVGCKEPYKK
jgi:hypothetical protein